MKFSSLFVKRTRAQYVFCRLYVNKPVGTCTFNQFQLTWWGCVVGGGGITGNDWREGPVRSTETFTNTEYISNVLSLLNWAVSNIYWFDQRRKKNLKIFKIGLVGMNSLYWHWCFPTKLDFPFHYSFLDTYEKNINKQNYKKNIFSQFHFFK